MKTHHRPKVKINTSLRKDTHSFHYSSSTLTQLLVKYCQSFFSQEEAIILEHHSSHQSNQPGELNDPLTSFICSVYDSIKDDSGGTDHLPLLNQLPSSLQAKSPNEMGKTHSAPPIKIQTDLSKSLPRINEYPISKETLQGIKPTTENYKAQGLIISFTSHCNTPILLVRRSKGLVLRFIQDL